MGLIFIRLTKKGLKSMHGGCAAMQQSKSPQGVVRLGAKHFVVIT
ncbi:hypothetical protein IGI67_004430 [Enterococcus sp. AZ196]